ncbi:MAG: hypothetical protein ABJL55_09565 [Roseibium sp.]
MRNKIRNLGRMLSTPLKSVLLRMLFCALLSASFVAFGSQTSSADWINLSGAETSPNIAEITVLEDRVRISLEIYVNDIEKMPELMPEDWISKAGIILPPQAERMEIFSREKLQVIADGETSLMANLRVSEPRLRKDRLSPFAGMINPITRQRAPEPPSDKRVLYVELDYPFDGKPETLTVIPPRDDKSRSLLSTGFIAYHGAVPIIDFRYLSDAVTLELDWDDPWYTKFGNPNLKRHHRWPMMSYLYIDPREVRHEAVIRLRDLGEWVDLDLQPGAMISHEQQAAIQTIANQFFANANPVLMDGEPVEVTSVRSEFLELSLRGVQVIDDQRDLDPTTAVLGVILSYPTEKLPKEVSVEWKLFTDRVTRVPATSVDPAGPFPSQVSAGDPVHTWTNHLLKYQEQTVSPVPIGSERALKLPVISLGSLILALGAGVFAIISKGRRRLVGLVLLVLFGVSTAATRDQNILQIRNPIAGLPGDVEASTAAKMILENANTAFLEVDITRRQSDLDRFLAAEPDPGIYAELDRAINIKIQGGTTARVDAVEDVSVSNILPLSDGDGFSGLAEWTAVANGQHWGHSHVRTIKYRARIDLAEDENEWRLAGLTVLDTELLPQ